MKITLTSRAQEIANKSNNSIESLIGRAPKTTVLFTDSLTADDQKGWRTDGVVEITSESRPIQPINVVDFKGEYKLVFDARAIKSEAEYKQESAKLFKYRNHIGKVVIILDQYRNAFNYAEKISHIVSALNDGRDLIILDVEAHVDTKKNSEVHHFNRFDYAIEFYDDRSDYWKAYFELQAILSSISTEIPDNQLEEYMLTYIANSGYDVSLQSLVPSAIDGLLYGKTIGSDGKRVDWLRFKEKNRDEYKQTFADTFACFRQVIAYEKYLNGSMKDSTNYIGYSDDEDDTDRLMREFIEENGIEVAKEKFPSYFAYESAKATERDDVHAQFVEYTKHNRYGARKVLIKK